MTSASRRGGQSTVIGNDSGRVANLDILEAAGADNLGQDDGETAANLVDKGNVEDE